MLRKLITCKINLLNNIGKQFVQSNRRLINKKFLSSFTSNLFENKENNATFLILPEIPTISDGVNEFLILPTTGEIPFNKLNVEKCVLGLGKLTLEFEHFIEEYSNTLKCDDQDICMSKLNEFISEMEQHIMLLHYHLNLLGAFRIIRPEEFNFKTFDEFCARRLEKSCMRFVNRNIYLFMCEMKARNESWSNETPWNKKINQCSTKAIKENKSKNLLDEFEFKTEQKRQLVEKYIRKAKMEGINLKHQEEMATYQLIKDNLQQEQNRFMLAAQQANKIFRLNIISPQFLDCLPDHVITQINHHDVTSVFNSFMRYCPDQTLRKDFWVSYNARAAPYFDSKINNFLVIEKIRQYRHRKAKLFGYENFAQLALEQSNGCNTMAGSVENVSAFINGLENRTKAKFEKDLQEITNFTLDFRPEGKKARLSPSNTVVEQINLWDLKYFERLFLREIYQVNTAEVRAYFPLDRVVTGMMEFSEKLFGIKIVEIVENKDVWGKNVRYFKIFDNSDRSKAEYGSLYFDPFQSESKIFTPIARSDALNTKPVVFFLMDFVPGTGSVFDQYEKQQLQSTGKELLNFSQVIRLFGMFGFALQHLLTQVNYCEIGGFGNIEVDAINLVPHFMEMWPLNSYPVIAGCSSHIKTGESMPEELFQRIRNTHYHFASFSLKYELYLMALDLNLHSTTEHSFSLMKRTWNEWMSPFERIEENAHICSWIDLFKGNSLEAIYYSNKWSEVIAADIFDAFREKNLLNDVSCMEKMGKRFKDTFLAQTGAIKTNELLRRFLGRDPTLNGYLTINGF